MYVIFKQSLLFILWSWKKIILSYYYVIISGLKYNNKKWNDDVWNEIYVCDYYYINKINCDCIIVLGNIRKIGLLLL